MTSWLPPSSQALGRYLLELFEMHSQYLPLDASQCSLLETCVLISVSKPLSLVKFNSKTNFSSWGEFVRHVSSDLICDNGHALIHPETVIFLSQSFEWEFLFSQLGITILVHLLADCSIIQKLNNNRFLQITGPILHKTVFQANPFPSSTNPEQVILTWKPLLYSRGFSRKFPLGKNNILYKSPTEICSIFRVLSPKQVNAVTEFLANLSKYPFSKQLEKLSPSKLLIAEIKSKANSAIFKEIPTISKYSVPEIQALRVIEFMLFDLIPSALLVSEKYKRRMICNFVDFLKLRKFDMLSRSSLVKNLPLTLHHLALSLLENLLIPLFRYCFYATEGDLGFRVVMFRKNVWKSLTNKSELALIDHLKLKESDCFEPDSSVRWVPKKFGMRPIMRQSKSMKMKTKKLLHVLNGLRFSTVTSSNNSPGSTNNSVLTRDQAYRTLIMKSHKLQEGKTKLFGFTADIRNCYESIKHDLLFEALDRFEGLKVFAFANYSVLSFTGDSSSAVPVRYKTIAYPEGDVSNCLRQLNFGNGTTVLIPSDRKNKNWVQSWGVFSGQIKQIVSNWSVELSRGKFRVGDSGIIQGSSLAGSLVAIYYGYLDEKLPVLKDSVVIRLVDDIFCASSNEESIKLLKQEIIEKQCFGEVNLNKCTGNFDSLNQPISWIGFNIEPDNQGNLNFSSLPFKLPLKDMVVSKLSGDGSKLMLESLIRSQRQRLLPVLLSSKLNSSSTVLFNAFKAGQISAARLAELYRTTEKLTFELIPIEKMARKLIKTVKTKEINGKAIKSRFVAGFLYKIKSEGFDIPLKFIR
jgi:Telomerase ribonucleoprotein complex - RNA binding domain